MYEFWWSLPGPARFLARLTRDMSDGRTLCLGLPAAFPVESLRDVIRRRARQEDLGTWQEISLVEATRPDRPPVELVVDALHLTDERPDALHDLRYLVGHRDFSGWIIWLAGWDTLPADQQRVWLEFLVSYARASANRSALEKSVFCLPARGPAALGLPRSDVLLSIHYWWQIISRLDMALYLRSLTIQQGKDGDTNESVLADLAGFDSELAEVLVEAIDAEPLGFLNILQDYCRLRQLDRQPVLTASRGALRSSPSSSIEAVPESTRRLWAAGCLDWVPYEGPTWHPALIAAREGAPGLKRLVWRAQTRTWLPLIDELRLSICDYLQDNYPEEVAAFRLPDNDPHVHLETGPLGHYFRTSKRLRRSPEPVRLLVNWLADARNSLAHLEPLQRPIIRQGLQYVQDASPYLHGTQISA